MSTDAPLVSVLVTAYNHERWVEGALDSIAAQTFRDFELVVMDDASTDGSVERIRGWLDRTGFPARTIFNETNLGICRARNNALSQCRGELVCFLAGDDEYLPTKLEALVPAILEGGDRVALVFGDKVCMDVDGNDLPTDPVVFDARSPAFEQVLGRSLNITPVTAVARRFAITAVGGYDETLAYEDYDMWLRLADRFDFRYVPGPVARYRITPSGLSRRPEARALLAESTARILAKWVGRSAEVDRMIARQLWMAGVDAARGDVAVGRRIFQESYALDPTPRRRLALLAVRPQTYAALRRVWAVRARLRAARRAAARRLRATRARVTA